MACFLPKQKKIESGTYLKLIARMSVQFPGTSTRSEAKVLGINNARRRRARTLYIFNFRGGRGGGWVGTVTPLIKNWDLVQNPSSFFVSRQPVFISRQTPEPPQFFVSRQKGSPGLAQAKGDPGSSKEQGIQMILLILILCNDLF